MLRSLSVPADNVRGPQYMDQALAALHQANPQRLPLTFAFARIGDRVTLLCRATPELSATLLSQLYAQYPDCRLEDVPEAVLDVPAGARTWHARLRLRPDLFPLRRYAQFDDALNRQTADPLTAVFTALDGAASHPCHARIEITVRPASGKRSRQAAAALKQLATLRSEWLKRLYAAIASSPRLRHCLLRALVERVGPRGESPRLALDTSSPRGHDREEQYQAAADKLGRPLFETLIRLTVRGPADAGPDAVAKLREIAGSFGQFHHRGSTLTLLPARSVRPVPAAWQDSFLLSTEELATLWHPPTLTVRAPALLTVESREFPPPHDLPTPEMHGDLAVLGHAVFRSRKQLCGILPADKRRHLIIEGKTGQGKSTLLQRLIGSDIAEGRGVCLVDPHGDLCEAVLSSVPAARTNDVILFDAGDVSFPVGFNLFACPDREQRPLVTSGIVSAFRKLYGEVSWGPRLEYILRNAVLALLEVPGTSLVSLLRLLSEGAYREAVLARVSDPAVKTFWQREFVSWHPKFQAEALAPVLNKVGAFTASPLLRNIIGQSRTSLDLRAIMDEGRVLLVNLSKGRVGDDASALLGSFLVTAVQLAAMSRAELPEAQRRDFCLYVDEFQNYATDSFATILSEARKYRLSITCANQFLAQVPEATLAAVFGNIGTLISFQVGAQDAELLAQQLGGDVTPKDLLQLPRYHAYCRLLIDGQPSRPFTLQTLPPAPVADPQRAAIIRRYCRQRYARPATAVEKEIRGHFALV